MKTQEPRTIYLKDYRLPPYLIDRAELDIHLAPNATEVASRLSVRPNDAAGKAVRGALVLDGEKLELIRIALNGRALEKGEYTQSERTLTVADVPAEPFTLEITTRCDPQANKALTGLYRSGTLYCTQCEAEGFRRITYYLDRPGRAGPIPRAPRSRMKEAPVLLANGNLVEAGEGRRQAAFRGLGRPVSEALLSVRHGRRQARSHRRQLHDEVRPQGRAAHLCASPARRTAAAGRWMR